MNLSEIVVRHQVQQQAGDKQDNTHLHFLVDTPNRYEDSNDSQKIVQVDIIDILYDNEVSNLVYMRDITSYVKKDPDTIELNENVKDNLDPEMVTNTLLNSPAAYTLAISDKVRNEIGSRSSSNILIQTEELVDALNRIRLDFMTVKGAWDLHCI